MDEQQQMDGTIDERMIQMEPVASTYPFSDKSPIDMLGPYRIFAKFTLLDCTTVAKSREGNGSKALSFITHFIATIVIIIMLLRIFAYMGADGKTMSLLWAESNYYGFMAIHTFVCTLCVYGWTKNSFIPKHCRAIERVRTLRVADNAEIDDYAIIRKMCGVFTIILFFSTMLGPIYVANHRKFLYSQILESSPFSIIVMPILAFFSWMIVSNCIAFYVLAQISIGREVSYFNEELQKACDEKQLEDITVFSLFSTRQVELIKMVVQANDSLGSYGKHGPLFVFISLINIVYLMGFSSDLPTLYFTFLVFSLIVTGLINLVICGVTTKVQDDLLHTSTILLRSDHFEKSEKPKIYQTYQTMLDRSLKSDAKIYLCNVFPLVARTANLLWFVVPNLGMLLLAIKRIFGYNGITL